MRLTQPIQNFTETLTDLSPKRRRRGSDIRECGVHGSNEEAKRLQLLDEVCGLARGGSRHLVAADVWALWAEVEGFAGPEDEAAFPVTLAYPLKTEDGREIVAIDGPGRAVLGGDMIAAGACGRNEDAKTLVYIERLCKGRDAAGAPVPLSEKIVDAMDGRDVDCCWGAIAPFFSGIPGPRTSGSGSPPSP